MIKRTRILAIFSAAALLAGATAGRAQSLGPEVAVVTIKVGKEKALQRVVIGLYDGSAPLHVQNFKDLVQRRYYNGMRFHRAFPGTLLQTGDPYSKHGPTDRTGTGGPSYTVPAEIRLPHKKGSLAMSRVDGKINPARVSNGSQFYICLKDQPKLNGEYSVFGRVLDGMDVLEAISRKNTDANNFPLEKIVIKSIILEPNGASS
ncbi:MAG: peptidylprolyl isomerase [Chthoniobacterales bacterium]|nr:peptidylprolyl isomerase [Chthoniobacterales bacterium]